MNAAPFSSDSSEVLFTGATGFIGRRLAAALAASGRHLALLCRPASLRRLDPLLGSLPPSAPRPRVVLGDLDAPDLGLSAEEKNRLSESVAEVFHLAAGYHLGMPEEEAQMTNVKGTRRMLDLAASLPRLRRFHQMSSIAVSGNAQGVFREEDLDRSQRFPHAYGRSKFLSEREVRSSGLPFSIYRPGVVVGDSRTGEIDKVDGPYYLFRILHWVRRLPGTARMPLIGIREDDAFFPLVPVDYVVAAIAYLSGTSTAGRTYQLVDSSPLSYREFYAASLRAFGLRGPILARPLARTARALMLPGIRSLTRAAASVLGMPVEMMPHLFYRVHYDDTNTRTDLAGTGIRCPPLRDYLPLLVEYFEHNLA